MARHGGRGWYGRVLAAAVGVTAVAAATSVWTAQAGVVDGQGSQGSGRPSAASSAPARATVSEEIVHASDQGAHGVNITIDDGPDPTWTPQVLQVLKEYGVKATFCMIGPEAEAHRTWSRRSWRPGTGCATTRCRTTPRWTRSPRPISRRRSWTPPA